MSIVNSKWRTPWLAVPIILGFLVIVRDWGHSLAGLYTYCTWKTENPARMFASKLIKCKPPCNIAKHFRLNIRNAVRSFGESTRLLSYFVNHHCIVLANQILPILACQLSHPNSLARQLSRNVCRILVRGVNAPLPPEGKFFFKFYYEMVHSDVYLNKYVVSIAPFSTPACPDCIGVRAIFWRGAGSILPEKYGTAPEKWTPELNIIKQNETRKLDYIDRGKSLKNLYCPFIINIR